jgi:hypothetical protein
MIGAQGSDRVEYVSAVGVAATAFGRDVSPALAALGHELAEACDRLVTESLRDSTRSYVS